MQLGAVFLWEGHVGQHVGLGLVHEVGQLGRLGAELIGHLAPLGLGGLGVLLGKGGGDEGRHHAPAGLTGMGQEVAHEVYAAALPGGIQDPGGGGLEAFMGIGDHQLDAAQAAPGQGAQELGPEGLGLRGADGHAQDLTPALVVDRHGDDHGDRDNAPQWHGVGVGIAVRKGGDELRMVLDKAIDQIRADSTYKTINAKYFDFDVYGE